MKKFQWTPNFYIILVGPPGVAAKSTSISMGTNLLKKVPGVKFGPESMTWQKLAHAMAEVTEYMEYLNPAGQKERIAMSCFTINATELGTLMRPDNDELISFLIRMWDGQVDIYQHDTISGGMVEIQNPWLNMIGATTPSWLKVNFPDSMIGGGLTSRIVFVYGDTKRSLIAYPDEVIPDSEYRALRDDLIADLVEIAKLSGPYVLSKFARDWGKAWYEDHNNPDLRSAHLTSERFASYIARKQTHLHKFAIILAAAKRSTLVIEEADLVEADRIIESTEQDMIKVFETIGLVQEQEHINTIISIVRVYGFMTSRGLWSRCMNHMSFKNFEEATRAAIHGRKLEVSIQGGQQGISLPGKGP
jgi:hypothetical protein